MAAIIRATQSHDFPAEVALVITPKPDTPAEQTARKLHTTVVTLNPKDPTYADQLLQTFTDYKIGLVCLAGYMTLFPPSVIDAYPERIINIHPALLPDFGGKGMYGIHVHEAVIAEQKELSGCTVHYVGDHYDDGAIILQRTCPVLPGDTPEDLAERVLIEEHRAYPDAIFQILTSQ
jgi:phosphoribosylglycinamide formyltransferase-1